MALINFENKKQVIILVVAVIVGIIATIMVGKAFTTQAEDMKNALLFKVEQDQKVKDAAQQEQMEALNQKLEEVEQKAVEAAQAAAKAAQERARTVVAPVKQRSVSLALKTPVGKRALTVRIDSLGAVGGMLNPGDFVDVIAQLAVPSARIRETNDLNKSVTAMIFQNLQVLAVNTNIDDPGAYAEQQKEPSLKVTFAVDPQEAGLLSFAEKNGKLELALRSSSEKGRKMVSSATWETLSEYVLENTGAMLEPPVKPVEVKIDDGPTKPAIQIYRGGKEL